MAAEKEERANTGGSPRRGAAEVEDRKAPSERPAHRAGSNGGAAERTLAQRRQQYLIALRPAGPAGGGAPPSIDSIADYLGHQDDVEIVSRMKPASPQPFGSDGAFAQDVVVARLAENRAESLRSAAQSHVVVERDLALSLADGVPLPTGVLAGANSLLPLSSSIGTISLRVAGERDQPLPRAAVVIYGPGFPAQAVTDEAGVARLSLFGGGPDSVRALYVRPQANYWERFILAPELGESGTTTIRLRPLSETFRNSPNERLVRWDQRLLGTDRSGGFSGAGIRVGIIDSGCDNSHPSLRHVVRGKDFAGVRSDTSWTDDPLGYGTHSAGLIAAASPGAEQGVAGAAPEAELHAFKVFPGGRLSDLLAALDECIAREVDVVSLHVGCEEASTLLDQKLRELRHKGIACIAAAGTFAGPMQFPAVLPSVFAVGAIGRLHEFPADTCHAQAIIPELVGSDGLFPAAFTGIGPHIAVAAPGVAILSTVPGGHAALDGTGIAAAQVAGIAALVLAHHPLFQGPLKARNEQRVSALFSLLRACAVPRFFDATRGGAGVPDLRRVPSLHGRAAALSPAAFQTGAPNPFSDPFGAGTVAMMGSGIELFPPGGWAVAGASPGMPVGWQAGGWQALMHQMRAAGLI